MKKNGTKKKSRKRILKKTTLKIRGGNKNLPVAEAKIYPSNELLKYKCKSDKTQKEDDKKNKYYKGGTLPENYIGQTWGKLIISNFNITDEQITSFRRIVSETFASNMDCVLSAMQIIGLLDVDTSNIIRITKIGSESGISQNEIELIFSLKTNKKFEFKGTDNSNEFIQYVNEHLKPGCVIFCGTTDRDVCKCKHHVFLIGKDTTGKMIKIDPQQKDEQKFCYLETDEICQRSIISENVLMYYLLFNYEGNLTQEESEQMGFIFESLC